MSKGHTTGMAGEFAVMENLFRLGHEPSLTLGNAKTVDIVTKSPNGKLYQVSVKSIRGGGKWGVGFTDYSKELALVFVFLHYRNFEDVKTQPHVWVVPSEVVIRLKRPWINGEAVYCASDNDRAGLSDYKDAWHLLNG